MTIIISIYSLVLALAVWQDLQDTEAYFRNCS